MPAKGWGVKVMDIAQLAQMVSWLDEEHRRDRAEIARLQQRLEAQTADIVEQSRRVQDLEGRLASTQAQLSRFTQIEQALENAKLELVSLVEREEEVRVKAQRESERSRLSDREVLSREISEVRRELPKFERLEELIGSRSGETDRLNELVLSVRSQIGTVAKDVEERTRQIPFLVEQRTTDTRRIAQLQQETVELFKRTEAHVGRMAVLEEERRKFATDLASFRPIPGQLREELTAFMEEVRIQVTDQNQRINRSGEQVAEQRKLIDRAQTQVQDFVPHVDSSRRALQDIQAFKEVLRRDQNQLQELQRLADERVRREMEEFQDEYEKRRRKEELRQEHLWQEQDKANVAVVERFPPLIHNLRVHDELLQHIWRLQEIYPTLQLAAAQEWIGGVQKAMKEREERMKGLEEEWLKQRRNTELYTGNNDRRRVAGVSSGSAAGPAGNGAQAAKPE